MMLLISLLLRSWLEESRQGLIAIAAYLQHVLSVHVHDVLSTQTHQGTCLGPIHHIQTPCLQLGVYSVVSCRPAHALINMLMTGDTHSRICSIIVNALPNHLLRLFYHTDCPNNRCTSVYQLDLERVQARTLQRH